MSTRECCGPSYGNEVLEGVGRKSIRTIALVGPPNSGKTTLFNQLTGLHRKVANFPGVTVEHFTGYLTLEDGERVALIDLPGIYSLNSKSEDERVTVSVLRGQMTGIERPDAIVLVVDSTNLGRHLALAAPVISLGLPTLVLLNMADSLRARDGHIDVLSLARQLGTPVALVSAVTSRNRPSCPCCTISANAGNGRNASIFSPITASLCRRCGHAAWMPFICTVYGVR